MITTVIKLPYVSIKRIINLILCLLIPKSLITDINFKLNKIKLKELNYSKEYIEDSFVSFNVGTSDFIERLNEELSSKRAEIDQELSAREAQITEWFGEIEKIYADQQTEEGNLLKKRLEKILILREIRS